MSKGSKRRPSKRGAYERGYQAIDWSKGRRTPAARQPSPGEALVKDYTTKQEWTSPDYNTTLRQWGTQ